MQVTKVIYTGDKLHDDVIDRLKDLGVAHDLLWLVEVGRCFPDAGAKYYIQYHENGYVGFMGWFDNARERDMQIKDLARYLRAVD